MVARKTSKKAAKKKTSRSSAKNTSKTSSAKKSGAGKKAAAKRAKATSKKKTAKRPARKAPAGKTAKATAKKATAKKATTKKASKVSARATKSAARTARRTAVAVVPSRAGKRRNPRLIQNLLMMPSHELESHFERLEPSEVLRVFDESYPSDLVNLLLGLKRSTCRRLFEIVTEQRKKAYLDIITLYYYKDYLTNPFPLQLESQASGVTMPNYYAIVGIARDATEDEMEMASKLLVRAFKPESFPPDERKMGDLRSKEIRSAFDRLKTYEGRQEVNRELPSLHYCYPKRDQSWLERVQRFSN